MKTVMKNAFLAVILLLTGFGTVSAEDKLGIFEEILAASGNFEQTRDALEAAIAESSFTLHAKRDVYIKDGVQKARFYVLTSPAYMEAAAGEAPKSISAQIQRLAVYEYGPGKKTFINMANPVAHAHVYYSSSSNADRLLGAATQVASELRAIAAKVPGTPSTKQLEPTRSIADLTTFNGDGPAKMMAGFANWEGNQDPIIADEAPDDFAAVVDRVEKALAQKGGGDIEDHTGWDVVAKIPVGSNAVYFGITNKYTENKCISINSDFRSDGKAPEAPFPGTDHATALPLEVLVINHGDRVDVVQYGEMWRMQLYFWDSGYRAFAKNAIIPAKIESSISDAVSGEAW